MTKFFNKSSNPTRQSLPTTPRSNVSAYSSYHAARQANSDSLKRQPEVLQKRQEAQAKSAWRRVKLTLLVIAIIIFFGFMTWLNKSPKIIVLGSSTQQVLLQKPNVYRQAAINLLNQSFTNHNKLTLNTENIASTLEKDYPELLSVSVQTPLLGDEPEIYLQPAVPELLLTTDLGREFVLSLSGIAVAAINNADKKLMSSLPVVTDQSGLVVQLGKAALPSSDVSFIQTIEGQLTAHHFIATSLTLPISTSELDVRLSGVAYFIKFNLEDDANQQVGTFLAVHKYLASTNTTPSQYIDVRVLGRAYYK